MSTAALDPMIHQPERLRVVATLAALPDGDALSATRLQDLLGLTPGRLITRLGELDRAGYVRTHAAGGRGTRTTVALTGDGRAALARYTAMLRRLPRAAGQDRPARAPAPAPAPGMRASDADRDAAAAALAEHFAHGRLTLAELHARLEATLTAATHGELAQATRDLPDPTMPPQRSSWPGAGTKTVRPQ